MNYIELPELPKGDIAADTCPVMWVYSHQQMQQYALLAVGDLQRQLAAITEDYKDLEAQLLSVGAGGVSKLMGNEE